ncbi:unnamed protein product [Hyaloperonospora brassicae]|uniref:RxLR effector candidate protein n=1 Tax=Hyaloperonospora brassicae TaxID=162125 RepID=A0AAV0UWT3_HYABA|nr:unnamed protein product [Hyaloperonospora brassicae]
MRVVYLVSAVSTFALGRADSLINGGQAIATHGISSTDSRLQEIVAHSAASRLLQSNDSVTGVALKEEDSESRVIIPIPSLLVPDAWVTREAEVWRKARLSSDKVFDLANVQGILGNGLAADQRSLIIWLEHVKWLREEAEAKHESAVNKLLKHMSRTRVVKKLVELLDHATIRNNVRAMLRIAAGRLPTESMVIPKKMLEMKMAPQEALDALDLARAGALRDHPFFAIQWVKYTILLRTTRLAQLKREKAFSVPLFGKNFNLPFTKANGETMVLSIEKASALLFKNKEPEEVNIFINLCKKAFSKEEIPPIVKVPDTTPHSDVLEE